MSVIRYEESFFSQIHSDIIAAKTETFPHAIFGLNAEERAYWLPLLGGDEEDCRKALAGWFVDHLWVANGVASAFQYAQGDIEGKMQIDRPPEWRALPPRPLEQLAFDLGRLDYNLSTNGGTRFLGVRDEERLRGLIGTLHRVIAERTIDTKGRTGN